MADFDDTKLKVIVTPDRPEYVTVHISLGAVGERLKVRVVCNSLSVYTCSSASNLRLHHRDRSILCLISKI